MQKIQAVVLDLYGTLIYLARETKPYSRLFVDMGLKTPEAFTAARNIALTEDFDDISALVKRINPHSKMDLTQYEREIEAERKSATLYSEVIAVMNELKKRNLRTGLISNLASPYKAPFFEFGLDNYFDERLFSCEVGLVKKDPRIYKIMLERFGMNPNQTLMIGDKPRNDVDTPRSIGMHALHLDRKNNTLNSIRNLEGIFQHLD